MIIYLILHCCQLTQLYHESCDCKDVYLVSTGLEPCDPEVSDALFLLLRERGNATSVILEGQTSQEVLAGCLQAGAPDWITPMT